MKDYDVVLGTGAEQLGNRFRDLGYRVYTGGDNYDERRLFPNADFYARLPNVEDFSGRRVVVIQSCTGAGPAEDERLTTADRLIELLLYLEILNNPVVVDKIAHKKYKTKSIAPPSQIDVVLTFQPFALQDKAFLTGEAASGRWAIEQIARACSKIWVVNPHATDNLDWVKRLTKKGQLEEIDIIPDLVEFVAKKFDFCDDYLVVTPDEGGQDRYDVEGFGKTRTNSFAIELQGEVACKSKNVVIIDDLTKSGSTLLKAAKRLEELGADRVAMAVAHVLPLLEDGEELLEKLVEKSERRIVTTNTVRTKIFCEDYPDLTYNIVDTLIKLL